MQGSDALVLGILQESLLLLFVFSFLTTPLSDSILLDNGENSKHRVLGTRRRRDSRRFSVLIDRLSNLMFPDFPKTLVHTLKTGKYAQQSASVYPGAFNCSSLS